MCMLISFRFGPLSLSYHELIACLCVYHNRTKVDELWLNEYIMMVIPAEIFEPNYEHDSVVLLYIHR